MIERRQIRRLVKLSKGTVVKTLFENEVKGRQQRGRPGKGWTNVHNIFLQPSA